MTGTVLDVLETAAATDGDVYLPHPELRSLVAQRLGVSLGAADIGIRDASVAKHVVLRGDKVYLARLDPAHSDDDRLVEVCSACLCAACWHGDNMCAASTGAGTTKRTVRELRELGREHASHYSKENVREVCGR